MISGRKSDINAPLVLAVDAEPLAASVASSAKAVIAEIDIAENAETAAVNRPANFLKFIIISILSV